MRNTTTNGESGRAPRIPLNLRLQIVGGSGDRAMLVNVAHGGVFVGTDAPAQVGARIQLQFRMLKARVCQATGTVVWRRPADGGQPPGFGVAFSETNDNMKSFVRNVSSLPEKLRAIYLADVLDPRIELGVTEAAAAHSVAEDVA